MVSNYFDGWDPPKGVFSYTRTIEENQNLDQMGMNKYGDRYQKTD